MKRVSRSKPVLKATTNKGEQSWVSGFFFVAKVCRLSHIPKTSSHRLKRRQLIGRTVVVSSQCLDLTEMYHSRRAAISIYVK